MERILIVGAHFDDAELGAGGTAAKLVSQGKKVYKLTLTNNVTDFKQKNIKVGYDDSLVDSANACKVLGIEEITDFIPAECNKLEYSKEIMQRVEKIIFDLQIDTILFFTSLKLVSLARAIAFPTFPCANDATIFA